MENLEKEKRIKKEKLALKRIFKNVDIKKRNLAERLIDRAAFMKVVLEDLEECIKRDGSTYRMEQGKQKMIVENPAQKTYNTMINRYAIVQKQLNDLLNKEMAEIREIGDGFEEFVSNRIT